MGTEGRQKNLIVMTNGDVYFVTRVVARELQGLIETDDAPPFYMVVDEKSSDEVSIATAHISSIVVKEAKNA